MTVLQEKINGKPIKTKDGRSWFFKTNYVDLEGNRKQFKSKKYELKSQALEAERAFLLSLSDKIEKIDVTFEELIIKFKNEQRGRIKISTLSNYNKYSKFFKGLYKVKLKDFNITHYNKWKYEIDKINISTGYKNCIYKFFKTILNFAIKYYNYNLSSMMNKMTNFNNPNELKKEMLYWTHDEYKRFIKAEDDIRYKTFFEILYYCGLRKGEANALNWKDVNFENKSLSITKNITQKIKGEKYIILTPKTKSSNRVLPLPNKVLNSLIKLKSYYEKFNNFSENWFIFGGIYPLPDSNIHKRKKDNCIKANKDLLPNEQIQEIRIHDFRHSCASLLINKGASIALVSKYLGHSNISTTLNTYTHMFKNDLEKIVEELNKL